MATKVEARRGAARPEGDTETAQEGEHRCREARDAPLQAPELAAAEPGTHLQGEVDLGHVNEEAFGDVAAVAEVGPAFAEFS